MSALSSFIAGPVVQLVQEVLLPLKPVQLPRAQGDERGKRRHRENRRPERGTKGHRCSLGIVREGVLAGIARPMPVLQGDQRRLKGPEQRKREDQYQRPPQHHMHPIGRREGELHPEGQGRDDWPDDKDHEDRGAIAAVGRFQVEAACRARFRDVEEAVEKRTDAATRAPAMQAGIKRRDRRIGIHGCTVRQPRCLRGPSYPPHQ